MPGAEPGAAVSPGKMTIRRVAGSGVNATVPEASTGAADVCTVMVCGPALVGTLMLAAAQIATSTGAPAPMVIGTGNVSCCPPPGLGVIAGVALDATGVPFTRMYWRPIVAGIGNDAGKPIVIVPTFAASEAPAPFVNATTRPPEGPPMSVGLIGCTVTAVAGAPSVTLADEASSGEDEVWTWAVYVPPTAGVRIPAVAEISIRTVLPAGRVTGVASLIAVPDFTTAATACAVPPFTPIDMCAVEMVSGMLTEAGKVTVTVPQLLVRPPTVAFEVTARLNTGPEQAGTLAPVPIMKSIANVAGVLVTAGAMPSVIPVARAGVTRMPATVVARSMT